MSSESRWGDHLRLQLIVLIWGYTGILGKWSSLPAESLVLLRMFFAFAALVVFQPRALVQVTQRQALRYLGIGLIVAAHWICFFAAIKVSNVSVALACMASTSVFAAFLEPLFVRRRVSLAEIFSSLLAAFGVLLIFNQAEAHTQGIALALLSSCLAAVFTILNGQLLKAGGRVITMSTYEMLGGFVGILAYAALGGFNWEQTTAMFVWSELGIALILGVVCTAIPFSLSIHVMRSLNPFTVCLSVNLEPVYAILLALLHFGESERMSPGFYGAAALILVSVIGNGLYGVLMQRARRSRMQPA